MNTSRWEAINATTTTTKKYANTINWLDKEIGDNYKIAVWSLSKGIEDAFEWTRITKIANLYPSLMDKKIPEEINLKLNKLVIAIDAIETRLEQNQKTN